MATLRWRFPAVRRLISITVVLSSLLVLPASADKFVNQLLESLMMDYNRSVRPVKNASDAVVVKFGANLCRLIDVDEVNQILTTSLWLEIQWVDSKLTWNPAQWGNTKKIHIPSDQIWIPDILLYNNADGEPNIGIVSMAMVDYKGAVIWMPPSIYKSACPIDIQYFPYDIQQCEMKFGGWSHDGQLLDLQPIPPTPDDIIEIRKTSDGEEYQYLELGMGLSFFHESAEWDLLHASSSRYVKIYPGCCGFQHYIDIRYKIILRRKALFFTVLMVIPCMLIAHTTIFVFIIPPREHKMTYANQVFVALTFYYLIVINLIPPTSLVIPLIMKYLVFTLFLVATSIFISVVNINIYRRPATVYLMPEWMRWLFVRTLPKYLRLKMLDHSSVSSINAAYGNLTGQDSASDTQQKSESSIGKTSISQVVVNPRLRLLSLVEVQEVEQNLMSVQKGAHVQLFRDMAANVAVIAANFRNSVLMGEITDEWRLMSLVIDRICMFIYVVLNMLSMFLFVSQAPTLFDTREPLIRSVANKPLSGDAVNMLDV